MDNFEPILERLEKVTVLLEQSILNRIQLLPDEAVNEIPSWVQEFQNLVDNELKEYNDISTKIGDVVKTHASMVVKCFLLESDIINMAANCSKPTDAQFKLILTPLSEQIQEIIQFRDKNRSNQYFNHLSAVSDSVAAVGWITQFPSPAPYVKTMQEAGEFYTNRIITEYKSKDPVHVTWSKSLMSLWAALGNYVKENHIAGLVWNSKGKVATVEDLSNFQNSPVNSVNKSAGNVPPPPPPPFSMPSTTNTISPVGNDHSTLFMELNRGSAVTEHLRKVTDDMKTHKNPALRDQALIGSNGLPNTKSNSNKLIHGQAKPKRLELQGNKWFVEHHNNEYDLQVFCTEHKQTVCVHNCHNCTVRINGKVNSIMLDNCKKTGIVFDNVISSLDVVNCQNVEVQCLGDLSTVNIDKTDGCQVFLSANAKSADIITSKSSGMNVCIPKEDGTFDEFAIPDQFKTNFTGKNLKTIATDLV